MAMIKNQDIVQSIADSLQYISYYHPQDFVDAMYQAYQLEESESAKDAIAQILVNSKMCALGHRPICQDTGIVTVFVELGIHAQFEPDVDIEALINQGVAKAYLDPENPLRASIVADPDGIRKNTGDNTPAVIHTTLTSGDTVKFIVAAKGGGSENKAKFTILNPSDDVVKWVLQTVPTMGAGWCPPGILGIGIGGTADKAMVLAKKALMDPIDIQSLIQRGPKTRAEELRITLYEKVNQLGIGAQGLGGLTTVLDVKVLDYPTHAASKPVAIIPNCAANRHVHFELDGSGPAQLKTPDLNHWPDVTWGNNPNTHAVDLQTLSREAIQQWKPGDTLLLTGKLLTGRDAAHKCIVDLITQNQPLPNGLDFTNRFIYYVGPVNPVGDEAVGPAGPTTATRMDKFTETMLAKTGLLGMIGKAERGPTGIEAIAKHHSVYLIATGGAAYLVSKAIKAARVVAFQELGMEAVYEFEVENMPVTVAVDAQGNSVHESGPRYWRNRIGKIPVEIV